jgi:hypothetical protein
VETGAGETRISYYGWIVVLVAFLLFSFASVDWFSSAC